MPAVGARQLRLLLESSRAAAGAASCHAVSWLGRVGREVRSKSAERITVQLCDSGLAKLQAAGGLPLSEPLVVEVPDDQLQALGESP